MGYWSQVYPATTQDAYRTETGGDVTEAATSPGSPVVATQAAPTANGPTLSLGLMLVLFIAIRLLVDRGTSPGS
jgi:hypothetical protein